MSKAGSPARQRVGQSDTTEVYYIPGSAATIGGDGLCAVAELYANVKGIGPIGGRRQESVVRRQPK